MTTFLYIVNEHTAKQTQGARYIVRKAHQWSVGGSWIESSPLAYTCDGVLKLEDGQEPVWVKNRQANPSIPTEKKIAFMLLQAVNQ